jgi:hypothetical protein
MTIKLWLVSRAEEPEIAAALRSGLARSAA